MQKLHNFFDFNLISYVMGDALDVAWSIGHRAWSIAHSEKGRTQGVGRAQSCFQPFVSVIPLLPRDL